MTRQLLRPGWLALHVLVAAGLVVMVRLGGWQWGRGVDTDSLRNYAYGLEWWAFAVLCLIGWIKICRDETSPERAVAAEPAPEPVQAVPVPAAADADGADGADDPELAAWNAHLAELARRDAAGRP